MERNQPSRNALGALILPAALLLGCATDASRPSDGSSREADTAELLRLNEQFSHSQIIARNPGFLAETAVDEFRVLAPGGLIENKQQAIAGVAGWDATKVELTDTEVVFHGEVALVMGRMDIDGEMQPVGRWGPLKYMSTWVRDDGQWRVLSRSLTPCLDMLIKLGRC